MKYLLTHAHLIIDGQKEYLDGALLIDDEKIEDVFFQSNKLKEISEEYKVIDIGGDNVMPGFFDTCCKSDLSKEGTTSYLSLIKYESDIDKMCNDLKKHESTSSRFLGFNLDGPFLSDKYVSNTLKPDLDILDKLLESSNDIKQMTVSCELENIKQIINKLKENNIKVMCGHSNAVYEDLDDNIDGISNLFKEMKGLDSHNKTLVNCAFMNKWYCELNVDDVDDVVLKLVLNNIDKDKLILVSDINKQMKALYKFGAKYTDLLRYSSLNAYELHGLSNRYGTLNKGKCSDLVIMDDDLNIKDVLLRGNFIYV